MRWRLILEEYGQDLIYIQDSKTTAADALSRWDILDTCNPVKKNNKSINEHYSFDNQDISHPTNYRTIVQCQQKDQELI